MEESRTMTSSVPFTAVLTCHRDTYSQAVRRIEARIGWREVGVLAVTYTLEGDIKRLCIPRSQPPRPTDGLWRHTCFEAFVAVKGKPEYYEFNFSPSRAWAAYGFRRYRDRAPLEDRAPAPRICVRRAGARLDLDAIIHLPGLSMMAHDACLSVGLSAVIEEENGVLSYWALKHPRGKPDFHHRDAFALDIEPHDEEMLNEGRLEKR